jgi:hypothetical protein
MCLSGPSFFGLPGAEDEGFLNGVRAFKMAQLSELRLICQEVGTLSDARSLPLEIRKWWVEQMTKKNEGGSVTTVDPNSGKRFVTKDVK